MRSASPGLQWGAMLWIARSCQDVVPPAVTRISSDENRSDVADLSSPISSALGPAFTLLALDGTSVTNLVLIRRLERLLS